MAERPNMRKCYGKSPNSGKPVGERHRWPSGWGNGFCLFCGRCLDDLLVKPKKPAAADLPLDAVIERCVDAAGVALPLKGQR